MLTSNQIKLFASLKQKKYREEEGKFLIEGFHLVEECLGSPYELEYIILRNDLDLSKHPAILEMISKTKTIVEPLPEKSFAKLVETESSQGIIGVVAGSALRDVNRNEDLVIALDRISDPGNLGTIIRTAYWFGVTNIILGKGSADPFNSKVLRSSQGAIFHVNITEDVELAVELSKLQGEGYSVYLFTLNADRSLSQIVRSGKSDKSDKLVIVFGSEAHGISEDIMSGDYTKVKVEGFSGCESLNVAVTCGIALWEFRKNTPLKDRMRNIPLQVLRNLDSAS